MAEIVVWGARGSVPGGTRQMGIYGSNTACVSVTLQGGMIVFDAGTGIVPLGRRLEAQGWDKPVHICLSHLHLDHILGLGSFAPLFIETIPVHLYAMGPEGETGENKVKALFEPPYWPKAVREALDNVFWHEVKAGDTLSPFSGIQIATAPGIHEAPSLMYRVHAGEKNMAYLLDCETGIRPSGQLMEFVSGCDLVIADGMYTEEEYDNRKGWGHGTCQQCVQLGVLCGIPRMLIAHHSPVRTDRQLKEMQQEIDAMAGGRYRGYYRLAAEGDKITL